MRDIRWFLISPFEVERIQRIEADDGSGFGIKQNTFSIIPADEDRHCLSPVIGTTLKMKKKGECILTVEYTDIIKAPKTTKDRYSIVVVDGDLIFRYDVCRDVNQQVSLIPI